MGIKRSSIEEVRNRVSLVDAAGRYTTLKRAGREFQGLSPFKAENTPSFFVSEEKNVFKCYSSGEGGDLYRFIQLVEHVEFPEAVEILAERYGIPLEYEEGGPSKTDISLRRRLFAIHQEVAHFYRQAFLRKDRLGDFVRGYWTEGRGFQLETAERWGVGIAPPETGHLETFLRKAGFSSEELSESGLFFPARSSSRLLERFRGRLMIPIRDEQGRIVAFTARQLEITPEDDPTQKAKYVNSPETVVFSKSQILFGLDLAREAARDDRPLILVEGQLDAIRMHEVGWNTAVASQGTAITDRHLQLAKRYSSKLTVLLDGDDAGQRAVLKLFPVGLKAGVDLSFATLGKGEDPDTVGRSGGKDAVGAILGRAIPGIRHVVGQIAPEPGKLTPNDRSRAVRELFDMIVVNDSEIVREGLLGEIGRALMLAPDSLRRDWERYLRRDAPRRREGTETAGTPDRPAVEIQLTNAAHDLLLLLLHFEPLRQAVADVMDCSWVIGDSLDATLLRRWTANLQEGFDPGGTPLDSLPESEAERHHLSQAYALEVKSEDPVAQAEACVRQLYMKHLSIARERIIAEMNRMSGPEDGGIDRLRELQKERIELRAAESKLPSLTLN